MTPVRASQDFSAIDPNEEVVLSIDFGTYLPTEDTVASVTSWTCTVAPKSLGADNSPASRLVGSPSASGNVVTQVVGGCIANAMYVMEAAVVTSGGQHLSIWAFLPCGTPGIG